MKRIEFFLQPLETALLLCMMMKYCSEDSQVLFICYQDLYEIKLRSDVLLDNVRQAMELSKVSLFRKISLKES